MQNILRPSIAIVLFIASGCHTSPQQGQQQRSQQPSPPTSEPAATVVDARPAALIEGRSLSWGDLRPILSEAAGAQTLREVILDRAIARRLNEQSISIHEDDVEAERELLMQTLSDDPDRAVRLLEQLRASEGLGPVRFDALLHRNAALRALVRDQVNVTNDAARRMFDTVHGPKRQARLMILPTLGVAREATERMENGEFFGDVAVELSSDASASRGGLLEPISRSDGSYPEVLRKTLFDLETGEISRPILINDQYALLELVREIEGDDVDFDDVRDDMRRRVRLQQQRALMDQQARSMMRNIKVTIFDESLNASWRMSRQDRP